MRPTNFFRLFPKLKILAVLNLASARCVHGRIWRPTPLLGPAGSSDLDESTNAIDESIDECAQRMRSTNALDECARRIAFMCKNTINWCPQAILIFTPYGGRSSTLFSNSSNTRFRFVKNTLSIRRAHCSTRRKHRSDSSKANREPLTLSPFGKLFQKESLRNKK